MAQKYLVEVMGDVPRKEVVEAKNAEEAKLKVRPSISENESIGKVLLLLED